VGEWTRLEGKTIASLWYSNVIISGVPDYSAPATDLKSCGVTILGNINKFNAIIILFSIGSESCPRIGHKIVHCVASQGIDGKF
jgi:hypothetical protein